MVEGEVDQLMIANHYSRRHGSTHWTRASSKQATPPMEISYETISCLQSVFLAHPLQVYSARRVPAPTLSVMAAEQDVDKVDAHVPHLHHRRPGSQRGHSISSGSTKVGREQAGRVHWTSG
jgi:hypothetical protein